MKVQTYRDSFEVAGKRETLAVARRGDDRLPSTPENNIVIRSSRRIEEVTHALLMVAIVGAHPLWVMWFLVDVFSW